MRSYTCIHNVGPGEYCFVCDDPMPEKEVRLRIADQLSRLSARQGFDEALKEITLFASGVTDFGKERLIKAIGECFSPPRKLLTEQQSDLIEALLDAWAESDDLALPGGISYAMAFELLRGMGIDPSGPEKRVMAELERTGKSGL